jgi:biotin carboxyl carrier protein
MRYYVTFPPSDEIAVDVTHVPTGELRVEIGGQRFTADVESHEGAITVRIDGRVVDLWIEGEAPDVGVVAAGHRFYAKVESERMRALSAALGPGRGVGEGVLKSPMPGRVLKVLVAEGDHVKAGAALVVVEAMKMENELCAGRDGRVTKVHVQPGDTVEGGAKLVEVNP